MSIPATETLGPRSILGRLASDPGIALTGFPLGILQLMHPAVSAGVLQHSDFLDDPFDRIYRSVPRIVASITAPDREARAVRIRDYHRDIKGYDAHGARYHALDPDVFWWTHMTFVWGFLQVSERFHHRPLTSAQRRRFYAESVTWWRSYGLSERPVAPDLESFLTEFDRICRDGLEATEAAVRAISGRRFRFPLLPGAADAVLGPAVTPALRKLTYGQLPAVARDRLGIDWTAADRIAFETLVHGLRLSDRIVPGPAARRANTLILRRLGATTRLASESLAG